MRFIYAEEVEPLGPVDLEKVGMLVVIVSLMVGLKFSKKHGFVFVF